MSQRVFGMKIEFRSMFQPRFLHENREFLSDLIMSDKAHFHLCGVVNE